MFEEEFQRRLADLRLKKGVSARDMSLSIGQNASYINNIENGKALPSMSSFLWICEYLAITPSDFFNEDKANPVKYNAILKDLQKLSDEQLMHISAIIKDLSQN